MASSKNYDKALLFHGADVFRFWNGDAYVGQFTASSKKIVFRAGMGKYCTDDGCIYAGEWQKDALVVGNIMFPNSYSFEGTFEKGKYTGAGQYKIPKIGILHSTFKDNLPEGPVSITDVKGFQWNGTTMKNKAVLFPKNQFIITTENIGSTISEDFNKNWPEKLDQKRTIK